MMILFISFRGYGDFMKIGEILPKYQAYRNRLQDNQKNIYLQLKDAKEKAENDASGKWADKAAQLQLSYEDAEKKFLLYDDVLSNIKDHHCAAWNAENNRALSDPETGLGATMGKIMTTVARMCAGDKVPISDEKKVMEYDSDMYAKAKMAQMTMAAMKKKQKEYDSLWDEEEENKYDCEKAADNTEYSGELPDIPEDGNVVEVAVGENMEE